MHVSEKYEKEFFYHYCVTNWFAKAHNSRSRGDADKLNGVIQNFSIVDFWYK